MSQPVTKPSRNTQLRREAEARLKAGAAAATSRSLGVDALEMLHRLSSSPETAADALKLLHELQVHQVELDMQSEELSLNEHRLVEEFSRYKELYEFAPHGYFMVDFHGEIIESNRAGAELFGVARDQLTGESITRFLSAESCPVMASLLQSAENDHGTRTGEVILAGKAGALRRLQVVAKVSPDKRCILLACCEYR
jgi:PAS domain S-box-containing protein